MTNNKKMEAYLAILEEVMEEMEALSDGDVGLLMIVYDYKSGMHYCLSDMDGETIIRNLAVARRKAEDEYVEVN